LPRGERYNIFVASDRRMDYEKEYPGKELIVKLMRGIFLFMLLFLSIAIQPAQPEVLATEQEEYYFEEGLRYYKEKQYELALKNFLEALELNPKNRLILKYVNMTGDELKRREEQELFDQAITDYHAQNYEQAISKLVRVLDLNPRNREAIDCIQEIKRESIRIEETERKGITEGEELEAEKPISPEISRIAEDIEILKKEIAKAKVKEARERPAVIPKKELPAVSSGKRIFIRHIPIALLILFSGGLVVAFFTYKAKALKRREMSDKHLKLMENLSRIGTNAMHKDEVLDNILRAFVQATESKSGALFTTEDKTGDLILGAGIELNPNIRKDLRFSKGGAVFSELTRITNPVTAAEALEDATYENLLLFKERPVSSRYLLLIPLTYKNRNVGVVLLNCKRYRRNYLQETRGLIETLAGQAAIVVANIAYDRQVIIDGLTGLYVHWFFYQCLEKEISRAARQNSSLALLMVDLDHFKQFNDNYGHPTGDKALVKVAEILKNDLRDIDTVARYGGEEFGIILPGVDENLAFRTAERIRKGMESYHFKVIDGKFRLTLSIGISIYEKGVSAEQMVERADKALYWVKEHGRNQVKSWTSLSTQ